jgi:group I intron endonuclease
METKNTIYAYRKKSTQKIVYVGQTVDLETRHKKHICYDPFNINTREYDYPLSRGIRKYGEDEYELIILEENVPKAQLNEREKYWIAFYDTYFHGYN